MKIFEGSPSLVARNPQFLAHRRRDRFELLLALSG